MTYDFMTYDFNFPGRFQKTIQMPLTIAIIVQRISRTDSNSMAIKNIVKLDLNTR